ncbi:MAG: hypothetical protein JW742_06300 [Candidatus Aminicenantes bacterium]|nr:hypothetical protein [Candidatus Aminicenantes bacterium]
MTFRIIALLALAAAVFRLSLFRFQAAVAPKSRIPEPFHLNRYRGWLQERFIQAFRPGFAGRAGKTVEAWLKRNYPGWRAWVWGALALSFGYLAASGLVYAIFVPRGLWGVPLLLHVMAGALFAVSLAAVIVLRARRYGFEPDKGRVAVQCLICPVLKLVPVPAARAVAFWVFAAAGLVLTVTALLSMLPWFVYSAQLLFIAVHRYAALAATLAAIAWADFDLIPRGA